jgi:transposase
MDVVHPRCCGLDVHKKTVVACVLVSDPKGRAAKQVRTFGTLTDELLGLADWLAAEGVTHVAMEATGVYWKPPWNLLEDRFALLLVNARHIKAVPGRKPTSGTPSGWRTCCVTGCCGPASSPTVPSGSCGS